MITFLLTNLVQIQNCGSICVFHDSELNVYNHCKEGGCTQWGFLNHSGVVCLFVCGRVHGLPAGKSPANPCKGVAHWGFLNHHGVVCLFVCTRVHGLPEGQSPTNPFFHPQIDPFVKSMVCQG